MIEAVSRRLQLLQLWWLLRGGQQREARDLLDNIDRSRLPWWGKLFAELCDRRLAERDLKRQLLGARRQVQRLQASTAPSTSQLQVHQPFVEFVRSAFQLRDIDGGMVQCTGIDTGGFELLEQSLLEYLKAEFDRCPSDRLDDEIEQALADLEGLKHGIDPNYNCLLTPHVYFLKYFLDNTYCAYLAWFWLYRQGYLSTNVRILDIGAGSGAALVGLSLLLNSHQRIEALPPLHLSYYSFERRDNFQFRGLQFWRKFIGDLQTFPNVFYQFDTGDIFNYKPQQNKIPGSFFDIIVICHCFFADPQKRDRAHQIYRQIFQEHLKPNGHVLLILQWTKLFKAFDLDRPQDSQTERQIVEQFLAEELHLSLVDYRYFTSTGKRHPIQNFGQFARQYCPEQRILGSLSQAFLKLPYRPNYLLDDYIILARPRMM